jgi:hypothetical protein
MRALCCTVAVMAVVGFVAVPAARADLAGNWLLTFNTPNGAIDATAALKVDGEKLTGSMKGEAGETPLTGSVKGDTFTIAFEVQTPNGNFSVTMQGQQEGDAIKGTFDFGQGTGDWVGKRSN